MKEQDRWKFICELDDELLKGGVIVSEWCTFIIKDTDVAFVAGAHLATIVTAVAGIETYLRSEYAGGKKNTLYDLIELSTVAGDLKSDLHTLRKYRNKWVHVSDPWDHQTLLENPESHEKELQDTAMFAVRVLRRTVYSNQWV